MLREEGGHRQGTKLSTRAMRIPRLQRVLLILAFHGLLRSVCLTFLVRVNESKIPTELQISTGTARKVGLSYVCCAVLCHERCL